MVARSSKRYRLTNSGGFAGHASSSDDDFAALLLQTELDRYRRERLAEAKARFWALGAVLFGAMAVAVAATILILSLSQDYSPSSPNSIGQQLILVQSAVTVFALTAGAAGTLYATRKRTRERRAEYATTISRAERMLNELTMELHDKEQKIETLNRVIRKLEAGDLGRSRRHLATDSNVGGASEGKPTDHDR
ncbi:hypothetical protein J2W21_003017 [Sinomonas atrocyanea]|uniref:hypothetical protein n=1 Tax=Sinomonas atrocyanea TaxID=37927 RepID=UPI00278726B0|nr:hypothetical protein [Sinomonas atrocyanea]MDP9885494.1 hypothetical protein [Sinomonas atrocyanea]